MSSTLSPASVVDEAALLAELGIAVPRQFACRTAETKRGAARAIAKLPGDKVVIKVSRPFIAHKTEVGGVRIVAREAAAIEEAIHDMALRLDAVEVMITEFVEHDVSPGGELLLAVRWTDEFGPIVTLGAGGTATEILSSVAVFAPGLSTDPGVAFAGKSFAPLVTGFRNQKARIPAGELQSLLKRCLAFASTRLPHSVSEIEINPLVPTPRGLYALDVLIAPGRPGPAVAPDRPFEKIAGLLHPKSVAVMGVSSNAMNAGRVIARNAAAGNAAVTIVKRGSEEIDGIRCVPDLEALEPVDLLVLSIPAEQVPATVDEVIAGRKAESMIVIPGGLGEHEGSENLEKTIRASLAASRATEGRGPVINGANCLGVSTPEINTIFLPSRKFNPPDPREVPVALVSQSGALAVSAMTKIAPYKPRYVVSIGNQLDLTVGDYLQHLVRDASVDVFAFYVEGFAPLDGRRWVEVAARAAREGRRVILYRAGRTPAGQKASSSHTAALAGDIVVARELCRANGILFAESLDDFVDTIRLSALLRGRDQGKGRLAAVSNAGFEAVAIADNLGGLQLAALGQATRDAIAQVLRDSHLDRIVTIANPLDVNPMLGDAQFARVARLLLEDDSVDAAVIGPVPLTGAMKTLPGEMDEPDSIVNLLTELWSSSRKPWVVSLDGGPLYDPMARVLHERGIPVFRSGDRAVRMLAAWCGR